jgi:hypothetical protein
VKEEVQKRKSMRPSDANHDGASRSCPPPPPSTTTSPPLPHHHLTETLVSDGARALSAAWLPLLALCYLVHCVSCFLLHRLL